MTDETDFRVDFVCELLAKSVDCRDANEAMKFTQAALNAANALSALAYMPKE